MDLRQLIAAWIVKCGVLIDFLKGSGSVRFLIVS